MVGRPREFDVDEALNAAMATFWAKGYEATSLSDLMAATGLHKGSLYQAFGDKHTLFVQVLKRYLETLRREAGEPLRHSDSPLEGLRASLHRMVDMLDDSPHPMGCLAINALIELAPHDTEVKDIMLDHVERVRTALTRVIGQAQEAGQISTARPPELLAAMFLTLIAGIGTTIKGPLTKPQAHKLVDTQLAALA